MLKTLIKQNTRLEKSEVAKRVKVDHRRQKLEKEMGGKNVKKGSKINFAKISKDWTHGTLSKKTMLPKRYKTKPGAKMVEYGINSNKEASSNLNHAIKNQWRYEKYRIAKDN